MKSKPQKRTLLSVAFLLAFVWGILLVYKTLWLSHNTSVFEKIPSNANLVFRVNGSKIIRSGVFTVLMEARDPLLVQVINEAIQDKRAYEGPSKNIGVDWLNDFAIFTLEENNRYLIGITAHLKSEKLLNTNAKNYFDAFSSYASDGESIVILKNLDQKAPLSKKRLNKIALKILKTKNKKSRQLSVKSDDNAFVLTSQLGYLGSSSLFSKSALFFKEEMNGFSLKGDLGINQKNLDQIVSAPMLKAKGLHLQTRIIPEPLQSEVERLLKEYGLPLPKIDAIGANYFGSNIENTQNGLKISPSIELMIHFKEKTDLLDRIKNSSLLTNLGWKLDENELTNGIIRYEIKKIDAYSYLLFKKGESPEISNSNTTLFQLSGVPKSILELNGDPFILGFIRMFQLYKSSAEIFNNSEFVEVKIQQINSKKAVISGQYRFKNNVYPLNEVFKYAISNSWLNMR